MVVMGEGFGRFKSGDESEWQVSTPLSCNLEKRCYTAVDRKQRGKIRKVPSASEF